MPVDMDNSSTNPPPPPQISEMFQKLALAFKTKTFEFFTEEEEEEQQQQELQEELEEDAELNFYSLLDSSDEIITGQKVVVIKPDNLNNNNTNNINFSETPKKEREKQLEISQPQIKPLNTRFAHTLISSLFATLSSFQASYLQLQTAHVPFREDNVISADKAIVSHLNKLSELKQLYIDVRCNLQFDLDYSIGSCLEAKVEENQSKLRALGTVSNALQLEMDSKDDQVLCLKQELEKVQSVNAKLSKRVSFEFNNSVCEVLLSVRVFDSLLHDSFRSIYKFTKLLISLMKKANWDLNLAANSVYSGICYAKKGDNRYAFLSYVCLVMFRGFDLSSFGLSIDETNSSSLKQLVEHVCTNPMEVLRRSPNCNFARFCENKYQALVHPTMESSIFSNLEQDKVVLDSWRSLSEFYESFVDVASSVWTLNKLAFSFDPPVDIFQVEEGAEFSIVYMEDITKRTTLMSKSRRKVDFTVVPGFKIGRTVIQCQVYLNSIECKR